MKIKLFVLLLIAMLALTACGGGKKDAETAGDVAKGKATYDTLCTACHGPGGVGVEGLGKPFTTSEFLTQVSDAEFVEFIKTGRDISDPENTTGIAMPPKGGNPALSEEQMIDIVAYVRTLQE